MALLVYIPLALTLRADPTLQQRVQQLEGPLTALSQGNLTPILGTTLATLGVFSFTGDPRWTYMLPGRPFFDPLTAVFFYAGLALAVWRFKKPTYAFLLFWLAVGLLPSAITPQAPSTIRMIGAMPAVYIFPPCRWPGCGAKETRCRLPPPGCVMAFRCFWPALFLLNLVMTIHYGFVRWPQALETRLKYQSVLVDMAGYLRDQPVEAPVFADGFYRPITADSLRRDLGARSAWALGADRRGGGRRAGSACGGWGHTFCTGICGPQRPAPDAGRCALHTAVSQRKPALFRCLRNYPPGTRCRAAAALACLRILFP